MGVENGYGEFMGNSGWIFILGWIIDMECDGSVGNMGVWGEWWDWNWDG